MFKHIYTCKWTTYTHSHVVNKDGTIAEAGLVQLLPGLTNSFWETIIMNRTEDDEKRKQQNIVLQSCLQ